MKKTLHLLFIMKTKLKFLLALLIIVTAVLTYALPVFAESATASLSSSSSNIKIGDTFTITASFKSNANLGSIYADLKYDVNILEYLSGDKTSGGAGLITISKWEESSTPSTTMKVQISFKAIKAGVSNISLTSKEIKPWVGEENLDTPPVEISVTVKDNTLSSNANLKSLTLSTGTLLPSFKAATIKYSVTVPYETEKLVISALAADAAATVTVNNLKSLVVGTNTQIIQVVAPSGAVKKYTITIIRQEKSGTSSSTSSLPEGGETEEYSIKIDDVNYKLVTDLADISAPGDCFVLDSVALNGTTLQAYKHKNAELLIVYLLDENATGKFFLYDKEKNSYSPFISILSGSNLYVVQEPPSDVTYQNFKKANIIIGGNEIEAWNKQIGEKPSDFYLLFALSPDGNTGWYQFDSKEMTLQRSTENLNHAVVNQLENELKRFKGLKIISYVSIAALLFIIILLFILLLQSKQKNRDHIPRHIRKD